MLFVILAAVMGGEARAVVVMGRSVVSERVGKTETVERESEGFPVAMRGVVREGRKAAGLVDGAPLVCWFPGGLAVARSDCGDRQAEFSGGTLSLLLARGVDIGGGTRGLLWTARRETGSAETGSTVTLRFNRYNSRGDVVGQSDAAGVTTWAAAYQADGRRTGEIGTNLNPKQATGRVRELGVNRDRHRANCLPKATRDAASGLVFQGAFAAGRSKEEDPTGLLNEGFRYRDMETGTFISRDPLGHVDGPNVYCYVGQNPWSAFDPDGLEKYYASQGGWLRQHLWDPIYNTTGNLGSDPGTTLVGLGTGAVTGAMELAVLASPGGIGAVQLVSGQTKQVTDSVKSFVVDATGVDKISTEFQDAVTTGEILLPIPGAPAVKGAGVGVKSLEKALAKLIASAPLKEVVEAAPQAIVREVGEDVAQASARAMATKASELAADIARGHGFTGTVDAIVKDGIVHFGASATAGGPGVRGLLPPQLQQLVRSFKGPWGGGCTEPHALMNAWAQGVKNLRGEISSARDVKTNVVKQACGGCKQLLNHLGITDIHKKPRK